MNYWIMVGVKEIESIEELTDDITVQTIVNTILTYFNFKLYHIRRRKRNRVVVLPRHLIAFFLRAYSKAKPPEIGKYINLDRTSVPHAYEAISDSLKTDPIFSEMYTELDKKLIQKLKTIPV